MGHMEDFHEFRSHGIGGSDAAAILGLSPFKSGVEVWEEKVGIRAPSEGTMAMKLGTLMEPVLEHLYEEQTGRKVRRTQRRVHRLYPFIRGHLDGKIESEDVGVEYKTASYRTDDWGAVEDGAIPAYYFPQVQHYLAITDYAAMDVAVLLGNREFRVYRIARDEPYITDLIDFEVEWWETYVVENTPPAVDGSEGSTRFLSRRFARTNGIERVATPEELPLLTMLRTAREFYAEAELQKTLAENLVKAKMGEARTLIGPGARIVWGEVVPKPRVDWAVVAAEQGVLLGEERAAEIAEIVRKHSSQPEPSRRFEAKFNPEEGTE